MLKGVKTVPLLSFAGNVGQLLYWFFVLRVDCAAVA